MSSFEVDFLTMCAWIFRVLVFGILPLLVVGIFAIYLKKILEAIGENRLVKNQMAAQRRTQKPGSR